MICKALIYALSYFILVGRQVIYLFIYFLNELTLSLLLEFAFFFFFKELLFIYLFNFLGCVGSSFLCKGFLLLRRAGATLHRGARASHCRGLSCCRAQAPDPQAQ